MRPPLGVTSTTVGRHYGVDMETDVRIVGGGFGGATTAKRLTPGHARDAHVFSDWTISTAFPRDVAQLGALDRPSPAE